MYMGGPLSMLNPTALGKRSSAIKRLQCVLQIVVVENKYIYKTIDIKHHCLPSPPPPPSPHTKTTTYVINIKQHKTTKTHKTTHTNDTI